MMNSGGLECETFSFTLRGLKLKVRGFRVNFVEVFEWFDKCDRLKIIFKSRKTKIIKFSFILNIIWNYHYISLICCRKNTNMYKWK